MAPSTAVTARLGRIVVVGGGLAGVRTCQQLRRRGHEGELILVAAEPHLPYDRPPLSKQVLLGDKDETTLPVDLAGLGVRVALGTTAIGLDLNNRVLHTAASDTATNTANTDLPERLDFDGLVIATGAEAITLPGSGEQFVVRTIDDALRLRERLVPGARVVIVGASWIGAEVATAALARGCAVTCVEAGGAPMVHTLGLEVGKRLAAWWDQVDLRLQTAVDHVVDDGVLLTDGTELTADVVVVGVGARPSVSWLAGSGLLLDGGVVVDEWLWAAPGVVAVGDAAVWWSRRYRTQMRIEHWDDAATGSAVAASTLLAADDPEVEPPVHDPIPYFWSDQFGHKIQYVGYHDPTATPVWREPTDGGGWSAAWLDESGRLAAVLTVDWPRELLAARRAIAEGITPDPARLADPTIALTDVGPSGGPT